MIDLPPEHIDQWKTTMREYKETKNKLPWGTNPQISYVNEKEKKELEQQYDPILQKYRDPNRENDTKKAEQENMLLTLAKNKVNLDYFQ